MAKKMDEAEVKKECPSCGLGVALDATICEFCGWDFEEEDEWILQIEKLERDLMLEKQKFEPGTVNHMIESTLHAPVLERPETARAAEGKAQAAAEKAPTPVRAQVPPPVPPAREREEAPAPAVGPERPGMRRVRTVKAAPGAIPGVEAAPKVRRIRTVRSSPTPERQEPEKKSRGLVGGLFFSKEKEKEPEKARVVRKVKK
ncbi:MAG: zinc ribbon domain-containing protein [Thermoplasmata archaeon]